MSASKTTNTCLVGGARGDGKEAGRINAHVRGVAALGREFVGARRAPGGQCPDLNRRGKGGEQRRRKKGEKK